MILTANLNPNSPYSSEKNIMSKYDNTKVYWNVSATLDTVEWDMHFSHQEFTTKHPTDVSAIHSTQLIQKVLVKNMKSIKN